MTSPPSARWEPPAQIAVRAPMKLVIAGEYAVLEPGAPGIVAAVDRFVTCTARPAADGAVAVSAPTLGAGEARAALPDQRGELVFEPSSPEAAPRLGFARIAAEIGYRYLAELGLPLRPLGLSCTSEGGHVVLVTTGERAKLGLGSSAATTVAVIGAVLAAHGVAIDRPSFRRQVFRLALVAHSRAQGGRGSGIDVAASAHGGLVEYGRAEGSWLRRVERAGVGVLEVARGPWPGLHVESLSFPRGMRLLAGFTGASAGTPDLVARVEAWRRDRQGEHETFVRLSQRATRSLAQAFRKGDRQEIVQNMALARKALIYLGSRAGFDVETPALARLAAIAFDAGGAGKLSGAGGGDCGIAIAFDDATAKKIDEAWRAAGITPIPVEVAEVGLHEVRESSTRAGTHSGTGTGTT